MDPAGAADVHDDTVLAVFDPEVWGRGADELKWGCVVDC